MLEVQHLYRSYRGIPAIEDVRFSVAPGEVVGFLGPNGAGKSTTVKIITGMLQPNDGRVLFEGRDIANDMVAFRAVFGYVPEEAHLYTYFPASNTCSSSAVCAGLASPYRNQGHAPPEAAQPRILAAFADLHLLQRACASAC